VGLLSLLSCARAKCRGIDAVVVRKTPLFAPFMYKNDHFTKTGSGQTKGELKKEWRFS
jgi:hypothetical protein